MREIKFKVWLKRIGKMTYPHTLQEWLSSMNDIQPDDSAIWLQYTGLQDKNGKDIYEGDITIGEHATYSIWWDDRMAQFRARVEKTKSVLIRHNSFPLWQYVEDEGLCRFEVIGNIYENKELVE